MCTWAGRKISHTWFSQFCPKTEQTFATAPNPTSSTDNNVQTESVFVREHVVFYRNHVELLPDWHGDPGHWRSQCSEHSWDMERSLLFFFWDKGAVEMVWPLTLVPLSTDDEELYIQQAVVFIEDAIQVSTVTHLTYPCLINIKKR